MPAGALRLLPFFAASVAVHAAVFLATGPERLHMSPAPAGTDHEVSIRLQAAAPAAMQALSEPPVARSRSASGDGAAEPPAAVGRRAMEPHTRGSRPQPRPPAPTVDRPERQSGQEAQAPAPATPERTPAPPPQAPASERVATLDHADSGRAEASSPAQRARLRQAIELELARHFRYPRLAQRRGWEGTVVLTVRVLADGRLDDIRVTRSSGRALLDRAALRSLAGIERLPELADRVDADGLVLEIPVTYRLEPA